MLRLSHLTLAAVFLGACGAGIAPWQGASKECDPDLGADACAAPFVCEAKGEAASCKLPRSQQLSEPCDPGYGIDACGAALVCAALDGRAVPTCYPERSRPDRSECTTDNLCVSGSCNTDAARCRSAIYTACDPAVGCAPDPAGSQVVCDAPAGFAAPICHRPPQPNGAPCTYEFECKTGKCSLGDHTCYKL